jgi:hypothetical protein
MAASGLLGRAPACAAHASHGAPPRSGAVGTDNSSCSSTAPSRPPGRPRGGSSKADVQRRTCNRWTGRAWQTPSRRFLIRHD